MKKTLFVFLGVCTLLVVHASSLVRNSHAHQSGLPRHQFCGHEFWLLESPSHHNHPVLGKPDQKMLFPECAIAYVNFVSKPATDPIAIEKIVTNPMHWKAINSSAKRDVPFFIRYCGTRSPFALKDYYEHDLSGLQSFLSSHPNFAGFEQSEWDNHLVMAPSRIYKQKDPKKKATMLANFPIPKTRQDMLDNARKFFDRTMAFYFNSPGRVSFMRAGWCLDHLAAAWGSHHLVLETTNTAAGSCGYRWQLSMASVRGAARQFNRSWTWYAANFYNGYTSKGEWKNNYFRNYYQDKGIFGPDKGMSRSLFQRAGFLAYLSGANFWESENWACLLVKPTRGKGGGGLTGFGKDFKGVGAFARQHPDRGQSYAPLALLLPFNQGYPNWGGKSWSTFAYEPGDWMIDGVVSTLIPVFNKKENMKRGQEGALYNSPFADFFDLHAVDAPDKHEVADSLQIYPAAILLGNYDWNEKLAEKLRKYVRDGGTLLMSASQDNPFLKADFTGVELQKGAYSVSGNLTDSGRIRRLFLSEPYPATRLTLKGAIALLTDSQGNPFLTSFDYGKGRVIFTASKYLTPQMTDQSLAETMRGRCFELPEYLLKNLQAELLPVAVTGDVQYGLNQTADGYWLYLINNNGVCKFVETPETIDAQKVSKVKVDLKQLSISRVIDLRKETDIPHDQSRFEVSVEPGEVKILHLSR